MKLIIKNGNELEIDLKQWKFSQDYLTDIINETEDSYMLSDRNKIEVLFPKEIIRVNFIPVNNCQILLNEALYKHYFGGIVRKLADELNGSANNDFEQNFAKIIKHKQLVFNKTGYF